MEPRTLTGARRASALLFTSLVVLALPGIAGAADEDRAQVLPDDALGAVVVDLDADGANELVRIVATQARGHVLEAWRHDANGWALVAQLGIPGLDVGATDGLLTGTDGSALLLWNAAGRTRVMVLARSGWPATDPADLPCCLHAYELTSDGARFELVRRPLEGEVADFFQAADLDADGTDELIRATYSPQGNETTVDVLRWDGRVFRQLTSVHGEAWNVMVGDTDDLAGSDVLFGPSPAGEVRRLAWVDGELVADVTHLNLGPRSEGSVAAIVGGAIVLSLPEELRVVRWPRGGEPTIEGRLDGLVYPYPGIVGSGSASLLAVQETYFGDGFPPTPLAMYDLRLELVGTIEPTSPAVRVADVFSKQMAPSGGLERYLFPYTGPMPGAHPADPAEFVWAGNLVRADGDGGFQAKQISPLPGFRPLGLAGPDDEWAVLGGEYLYFGTAAWIVNGVYPEGFGRITMVRGADLEGDGSGDTSFSYHGAVPVGDGPDGEIELAAGPDGFDVVVNAPPGSWVTAWNGRTTHDLSTTDPATTVTIDAPRSDENTPIRASLMVVTPGGRVDAFEWSGLYIREPPELTVSGQTDAFSLSATLEGSVSSHAAVTLNGGTVPVGPDGTFRARIDAPPWPQGIVVTARDAFGRETATRVEVVGLYDYRGLPWVAIVGVATVGVGAALFLRTPSGRRRGPQLVGDGRLEELESLDGVTLDGR